MLQYNDMRIVLVIKPYAIEVYSEENGVHTLIGVEQGTRIETESIADYEKRMIFICKDLCTDMRASPFFKAIANNVIGIDIVLCAPWCTYDVVQVEKDFEKPTKIDQSLMTSMRVRKEEPTIYLVESYTSNILLNGYSVQEINRQHAQTVQFQYIHIYAQTSFAAPLVKMVESVFHTHKVTLISVYGLTEKLAARREKKYSHEMRIILEEESIDVSYISEGMHVVNTFVPHSYIQLENAIAEKLSASHDVVAQILKSRYESVENTVDKNAKKLWPDLDAETKALVDAAINESVEKVLKSIRDCIDTISAEYTKDFISVDIYCLHKRLAEAYGHELALKIHTDPYIIMKVHVTAETITVESIF